MTDEFVSGSTAFSTIRHAVTFYTEHLRCHVRTSNSPYGSLGDNSTCCRALIPDQPVAEEIPWPERIPEDERGICDKM